MTRSKYLRIRSIVDAIEKILTTLCCIGVAVIMVLTSLDVLARYLFNRPILGAYEITEQYLMVAVVFLSIGYVYKQGGHVNVTMVVSKLPNSVQHIAKKVSIFLTLSLFILITIASWQLGVRTTAHGGITGTLNVLVGPAYFLVVCGSALLIIRLLEDLFSRDSSI